MTVPTITNLPTPPSRTDAPAQFVARADSLLGGLPTFVSETNALANYLENRAQEAEGARDAAITARNAAQTAASNATTNGAQQVTLAAGEVTKATNKANEAAASAQHAEDMRDSAQNIAAMIGDDAGLPALEGNAKKVFRVNASATGVELAVGVAQGYEQFLTSGTWTKPIDATWVFVEVIGGGGGGAAYAAAGQLLLGGLGGDVVFRILRAADLPPAVSVTVGAGAAAGSDGGTSSFGSLITATGGKAGASAGSLGSGDVALLFRAVSFSRALSASAGNGLSTTSTTWGLDATASDVAGAGGASPGANGAGPGGGGAAGDSATAAGQGAAGRVRVWYL